MPHRGLLSVPARVGVGLSGLVEEDDRGGPDEWRSRGGGPDEHWGWQRVALGLPGVTPGSDMPR